MSELNEETKGDATQAQDINPEIKLEETNVSNGKIDDMPTTPSPSDASSFHSITNDVDPTITPNAIGKTKPIQDDTDKIEEDTELKPHVGAIDLDEDAGGDYCAERDIMPEEPEERILRLESSFSNEQENTLSDSIGWSVPTNYEASKDVANAKVIENTEGSGDKDEITSNEENEEDNDGDKGKQERKDQLDDDQIKSNPAYIPKQGRFYMHDVRNNAPEAGNDESNDAETETKSRSRADRVDEWKHDLYDEHRQQPKTRKEIYQKYGEDIRCDDVPHQDADRESGVRRFQQQSRRNAPIERFHDTEKSIRQNTRKESFDSDEDNWAQSNKFENRKNMQRYRDDRDSRDNTSTKRSIFSRLSRVGETDGNRSQKHLDNSKQKYDSAGRDSWGFRGQSSGRVRGDRNQFNTRNVPARAGRYMHEQEDDEDDGEDEIRRRVQPRHGQMRNQFSGRAQKYGGVNKNNPPQNRNFRSNMNYGQNNKKYENEERNDTKQSYWDKQNEEVGSPNIQCTRGGFGQRMNYANEEPAKNFQQSTHPRQPTEAVYYGGYGGSQDHQRPPPRERRQLKITKPN